MSSEAEHSRTFMRHRAPSLHCSILGVRRMAARRSYVHLQCCRAEGCPALRRDSGGHCKACLHVGPLVIGGEARTLAVLGTPHRAVPQLNGAKALAWFMGEPNRQPYFVA